jgi:hypothetical protein
MCTLNFVPLKSFTIAGDAAASCGFGERCELLAAKHYNSAAAAAVPLLLT